MFNILKKQNINPCAICVYYDACGDEERTVPCKSQKKLSKKAIKIITGGK